MHNLDYINEDPNARGLSYKNRRASLRNIVKRCNYA